MKVINKNLAHKISKKFRNPDEFVYLYNSYIMGNLKDKSLISWFENEDEVELSQASDYYLVNNSRKFSLLKSMCKTSVQRRAFNALLKSFSKEFVSGLSSAGVADGAVEVTAIDDDEKIFAKLTSFKEFKSWIHNFMKEAHGDNYSEEVTEKVANDLNEKYHGDFGAMVGAAKSFLNR